jgi:hypothetical protein
MGLRGSRIENFDELWCLVASGDFDIVKGAKIQPDIS